MQRVVARVRVGAFRRAFAGGAAPLAGQSAPPPDAVETVLYAYALLFEVLLQRRRDRCLGFHGLRWLRAAMEFSRARLARLMSERLAVVSWRGIRRLRRSQDAGRPPFCRAAPIGCASIMIVFILGALTRRRSLRAHRNGGSSPHRAHAPLASAASSLCDRPALRRHPSRQGAVRADQPSCGSRYCRVAWSVAQALRGLNRPFE